MLGFILTCNNCPPHAGMFYVLGFVILGVPNDFLLEISKILPAGTFRRPGDNLQVLLPRRGLLCTSRDKPSMGQIKDVCLLLFDVTLI